MTDILLLVLSKLMLETITAIIIKLFEVQNCFVQVRMKTNVLCLATLVIKYIWVLLKKNLGKTNFPVLLADNFSYFK